MPEYRDEYEFQTGEGEVIYVGDWRFTVGDLKQIIREVINESYVEQADYYTEPGRELGEQPVHSEGA